MRLIQTLGDQANHVKLYRDEAWEEYVAIANSHESSSYHTGDWKDCLQTGKVMLQTLQQHAAMDETIV